MAAAPDSSKNKPVWTPGMKQNRLEAKLHLPAGFEMLLTQFSREVIRNQPNDILSFAAKFFEGQLVNRDSLGLQSEEFVVQEEDEEKPEVDATDLPTNQLDEPIEEPDPADVSEKTGQKSEDSDTIPPETDGRVSADTAPMLTESETSKDETVENTMVEETVVSQSPVPGETSKEVPPIEDMQDPDGMPPEQEAQDKGRYSSENGQSEPKTEDIISMDAKKETPNDEVEMADSVPESPQDVAMDDETQSETKRDSGVVLDDASQQESEKEPTVGDSPPGQEEANMGALPVDEDMETSEKLNAQPEDENEQPDTAQTDTDPTLAESEMQDDRNDSIIEQEVSKVLGDAEKAPEQEITEATLPSEIADKAPDQASVGVENQSINESEMTEDTLPSEIAEMAVTDATDTTDTKLENQVEPSVTDTPPLNQEDN